MSLFDAPESTTDAASEEGEEEHEEPAEEDEGDDDEASSSSSSAHAAVILGSAAHAAAAKAAAHLGSAAATIHKASLSDAVGAIGRVPIPVLAGGGIAAGLICAILVACFVRQRDSRHRAGGRSGGRYDTPGMAPSGGWANRGRRGGRQQRPGRAIMDDEDDDFDDDEDDEDDEEDDEEYGDIEESFKHARAWADARSETGSRSGRSHASIYGASRQQQEKQQQYENGSAAGGFGSSILGVQSIPAIYKTGDGACAVDIPLSNVGTIKALLEAVVHLGQAMVDADISAATIKVHYATGPGVKPKKVGRETTLWDLKGSTGLVVTPR